MWISLFRASSLSFLLVIVCGVIYPISLSILGRLLFPKQAAGSLLYQFRPLPIGSELLGQKFSKKEYFHARAPLDEFSQKESPSSLPLLRGREVTQTRKLKLSSRFPSLRLDAIPSDWTTLSGSFVDPHLSIEAISEQIEEIAKARSLDPRVIQSWVDQDKQAVTSGGHFPSYFLNVLKLNLKLDQLKPKQGQVNQ